MRVSIPDHVSPSDSAVLEGWSVFMNCKLDETFCDDVRAGMTKKFGEPETLDNGDLLYREDPRTVLRKTDSGYELRVGEVEDDD